VVQEAMMKLAHKYRDRAEEEWPALFHTILQSRIRDWQRREKVRSRWRGWFGGSREEDEREDPFEAFPADPNIEPPRLLSGEQTLADVTKAIGELPRRQQQAFLLRAWEGLDTAETARAMDCSEGSVKTHYFRALQALRAKLRGLGHE
jgi:RNA polymerase sigma-70 factor (ECF subfamily)